MDITFNTLQNLFRQLGLDSDEAAIERFIEHHTLKEGEPIESAEFWSPEQAAFLEECIQTDSDWAEVVDQLSVQLRLK